MNVFFSWSGHFSKKIAKAFKPWLKDKIFPGSDIDVFISEDDIQSGSDWFQVVKSRLKDSHIAVSFITRDNALAPWLNFEAGAIAVHDQRPLVAFLIDVSQDDLKGPLRHYQSVSISKASIRNLILSIKRCGGLSSPADAHVEDILDRHYDSLISSIEHERQSLTASYRNDFVIYPEHIKSIKKNKVFIGSPMAAVRDHSYTAIRNDIIQLKQALKESCKFDDVYYPGEAIKDSSEFDGQEKAIVNDFRILKESEHYIFVYPNKVASSVLMEIGYAIALSKNTIVFTKSRNSLPYMLKQADKAISNVRIYEYRTFDEVLRRVRSNGESLFTRTLSADHEPR